MKKTLIFMAVLFGVMCNAMADPFEYRAEDGFLCARVDEQVDRNTSQQEFTLKSDGAYSFAAIYFDIGKSVAHPGCEESYQEIVDLLKDRADSIQQLVFIGSADQQGNDNEAYGSEKNRVLSANREQFVEDLFNKDGSFYTVQYVAGADSAKTYSVNNNNQNYRAVDIYVIWKMTTCQQKTMDNVNNVENLLSSKSGANVEEAKKIVSELQSICTKDEKQLSPQESEKYQSLLSDLVVIISKIPGMEGVADNFDRIGLLYYRLNRRLADLTKSASVWKTEQGKFNTARLASDSLAGVVLGTAGGLITSHVVKKNQIKKGFEDISCTIGGQKVADWADEFTVGVQ